MKLTACALGATLMLSAWAPTSTLAQAPQPQTSERAIRVLVARQEPGAQPLVTLQTGETSVATLLSVLSAKTGAKIIINADAPLDDVDIQRATLPDAIAKIVEMAQLRLTVEPFANFVPAEERTYVVSAKDAPADSNSVLLQMEFKDISVKEIVKVLAEGFNIKAQVAPQVAARTLDIYMVRTTAIEALQTIADAADLEIGTTADGYVLRERAAKLDLTFRNIPTSQLFQTLAQQFGFEVRLAPNLPDKLINVDLTDKTPGEALNAAAKAADFDLTEIDGVYIVSERANTAKQ